MITVGKEGLAKAHMIEKILFDTMKTYGGVGLAANQIGSPFHAFATLFDGIPQSFFNMMITGTSVGHGYIIEEDESCLSFPHLVIPVHRHTNITTEYYDVAGVSRKREFKNFEARVVQHELDHLSGISIIEKCPRLQLKRAIKKCNKKHGTEYSVKQFREYGYKI
jgi:peptide deformylase